MAAGFTREEMRTIARDELRADLDRLRKDVVDLQRLAATSEASYATMVKAVERLSLIIVGDKELNVVGLVRDMRTWREERQADMINKAKVMGIWIGGSTVAVVVGKALWYLIEKALSH